MTIAVIRIRGTIKINRDIRDTLDMLRLHRPNHCVLVREIAAEPRHAPEGQGLVTWAQSTRRPPPSSYARAGASMGTDGRRRRRQGFGKFKTVDELAAAVVDGSVEWSKLEGAVPVFRLHPQKGTRHEALVRRGGALGTGRRHKQVHREDALRLDHGKTKTSKHRGSRTCGRGKKAGRGKGKRGGHGHAVAQAHVDPHPQVRARLLRLQGQGLQAPPVVVARPSR